MSQDKGVRTKLFVDDLSRFMSLTASYPRSDFWDFRAINILVRPLAQDKTKVYCAKIIHVEYASETMVPIIWDPWIAGCTPLDMTSFRALPATLKTTE